MVLRLICCLLLLWCSPLLVAASCPAPRIDLISQVRSVYDADTLTLSDGTRVRLAGIDAPELGRDGAADEPFAREGRDRLRQILRHSGQQVHLMLPHVDHAHPDNRDRYGRLRAQVFLADGRHVQGLLLEEGWVMHVALQADDPWAACLHQAERPALQAGRGIWSLTEYGHGIPAQQIPDSAQGAIRLVGQIQRIGQSRDAYWINLEGRVALQLPRRDWSDAALAALNLREGQSISARGWLIRTPGGRHQDALIRISHPLALERADF
ncbi:thermonuclease family protein [Marinospirillum sp. MEB164]|uniref:Thermonuclease family protein n=1 Tax=Marinospirillum alkalitolerans TaxID=3123374 RepID=A0ABW8PV79_9GAMM